MEKLMVFLLLLVGLNLVLAADKTEYFMEGGKLTLDLRPPSSQPITNILWKFKGNLLAEWVKGVVDLTYYSTFKTRTTLDTQSGRLEISNMTKADSGLYSVEINNKLQSDRYSAVLIKAVPQPYVWITPVACAPTLESCNATCKADTTDCGPFTYSWRMGDGEWKESEGTVPITKAGTSHVKTLTCRVKNPLTEEESKPEDNPLFQEEALPGSGVGGIVGGIFGVLILIGVVLAGVAWHLKKFPCQVRGSTSLDGAAGDVEARKITDTSVNGTAAEKERLEDNSDQSAGGGETA